MWHEFVVGSIPCSQRFSPGTLIYSSAKNQHFQILIRSESMDQFNEFSRTFTCFESKQFTIYNFLKYDAGDYRIPKPALTAVDGARLNVSLVAPHKGIVRGTQDHTTCSWHAPWNAYKCNDLDFRMLVIESLDADTETRRLSPVALISNGLY